MSNFTSEHGEIRLPRAEFTRLRRELATEANTQAKMALGLAKKIWAAATPKQKRDPQELRELIWRTLGVDGVPRGFDWSGEGEDIEEILTDWHGGYKTRPPQKKNANFVPLRAEVIRAGEAHVTFDSDRSTLVWGVDSNNHSVERAHGTWLARSLASKLENVAWARGTGGAIEYTDEYTRGGTYSRAYGPLGVELAPYKVRPYKMANGKRVTESDISAAHAKALRAEARHATAMARALEEQGRQRDGRFDFKRHSRPEAYL